MKRLFNTCRTALLVIVASLAVPVFALPADFRSVYITNGFTKPIALERAPDGRIFTIEQGGRVSVVSTSGVRSTFHTVTNVSSNSEDGLLGIALHPSFSTNGWIYLYYTTTIDGLHNRIIRIQGTSPTSNVSNGAQTVIYDLNYSPNTIHNGGTLRFYQGKLFVTSGDDSVPSNGQNQDTTLGKVLRLNDNGTAPTDNPFYTTTTARRSFVWAYGFRNPFTMDIRQSDGRIFIGNVGEFGTEAIKNVTRGGDYGWNDQPENTGAVYTYTYSSPGGNNGGCAILSGAWYQPAGGSNWPAQYQGAYFFSDWCSTWIRYLRQNTQGAWYSTTFHESGYSRVIGLRSGNDGALYYFLYSYDTNAGSLHKIEYGTGVQIPAISAQPQSGTYEVGSPFTLSVTACCSGLTYQWFKNNVAISGANGATYTDTSASTGDAGTYRVTITNAAGSVNSQNAVISVIPPNASPTATINTPAGGFFYTSGVPISFSGSGSDPETGVLPASAFSWRLDLHHDSATAHTHPGPSITAGVTSGSFTLPQGDHLGDINAEPLSYRLYLTVTDPAGKTDTDYVTIFPRAVSVAINTTPVSGLKVTVNSFEQTSPFAQAAVKGNTFIMGVVSPQIIGNKRYTFSNWSNGGTASQNFTLGDGPYSLTANFTEETITIPSGGTTEAETMTIAASSGDAIFNIADPVTSGGYWQKYNSNAVGDFIMLSRVVSAGTYQIQVKIKSFNDRGIVQLATSGVAAGPYYNKDGPKDFYTAAAGYGTINYTATVTFPDTGTKYFRFTVTGKNAASANYVIPLDSITLTPQ